MLHEETDLELMIDRDLSAEVSQESVRASNSALSWSHASLLAGPSNPETDHKQNATFINIAYIMTWNWGY